MPPKPKPKYGINLKTPNLSRNYGALGGARERESYRANVTRDRGSTSCLIPLGAAVPPALQVARSGSENKYSTVIDGVTVTMYAAPSSGDVPADLTLDEVLGYTPTAGKLPPPRLRTFLGLLGRLHDAAFRASAAGLQSPVELGTAADSEKRFATFFAQTVDPEEVEAKVKKRKPQHEATLYVPEVYLCVDGEYFLVAQGSYVGESIMDIMRRLGDAGIYEHGHLLSMVIEHIFLSDDARRQQRAQSGNMETMASGTFPRLLAWLVRVLKGALPGCSVSLDVVFANARTAVGCTRASAHLVLERLESMLLYCANGITRGTGAELPVAWSNTKQASAPRGLGGFSVLATKSTPLASCGLSAAVLASLEGLTLAPTWARSLGEACRGIMAAKAAGKRQTGKPAAKARGSGGAEPAAPKTAPASPAAGDPVICTPMKHEERGAGGGGGGSGGGGGDDDAVAYGARSKGAEPALPAWQQRMTAAAAQAPAAEARVLGLIYHAAELLEGAGGEASAAAAAPDAQHARAYHLLEGLRQHVRSLELDIARLAKAQAASLASTVAAIGTVALLRRSACAILDGSDLAPGQFERLARAAPLDDAALDAAARHALLACSIHLTDVAPRAQWRQSPAQVVPPAYASAHSTGEGLEATLLLLFPTSEEEALAMRRGGWRGSRVPGHAQLDGLCYRMSQLRAQHESALRWAPPGALQALGALLSGEWEEVLARVHWAEHCQAAARERAADVERERLEGEAGKEGEGEEEEA